MSTYAAPIEVVQAALGRIGEQITSLTDGTAPAVLANANYEGKVRATLAYRGHAWSFASDTVDATFQAEISEGPWTQQYALPTTVMKVRAVYAGSYRLGRDDYVVRQGKILTRCKHDKLQALVLVRAAEADWSDDFAEVVVMRLKALFLEGLLERQQDARIADKDADQMLLLALVSDRRQSPVPTVEDPKLARIWRGGRGRSV